MVWSQLPWREHWRSFFVPLTASASDTSAAMPPEAPRFVTSALRSGKSPSSEVKLFRGHKISMKRT